MSWNDGKQRKIFNKNQSNLAEKYRSAGMTEVQIQKMYEFDLDVFRRERIYCIHTQSLEFSSDDNKVKGDVSEFLLEYHMEDFNDYNNRYWWIEELEKLYKAAMSLTEEEKELITLYVFDGYTQKEIAEKFHCSQMAISKRLNKIKKAFLPAIGGNADE